MYSSEEDASNAINTPEKQTEKQPDIVSCLGVWFLELWDYDIKFHFVYRFPVLQSLELKIHLEHLWKTPRLGVELQLTLILSIIKKSMQVLRFI